MLKLVLDKKIPLKKIFFYTKRKCLQSYSLCLLFILFLPGWPRICNMDPDLPSCWVRIQCHFSTGLGGRWSRQRRRRVSRPCSSPWDHVGSIAPANHPRRATGWPSRPTSWARLTCPTSWRSSIRLVHDNKNICGSSICTIPIRHFLPIRLYLNIFLFRPKC